MRLTGFEGNVLHMLSEIPDFPGVRELIPHLRSEVQKRARQILEYHERGQYRTLTVDEARLRRQKIRRAQEQGRKHPY